MSAAPTSVAATGSAVLAGGGGDGGKKARPFIPQGKKSEGPDAAPIDPGWDDETLEETS